MPTLTETTPRGYPLPHPDHLLSDDVLNLREAITRIDADVGAQEATIRQVDETTAAAIVSAQRDIIAVNRRAIFNAQILQLM